MSSYTSQRTSSSSKLDLNVDLANSSSRRYSAQSTSTTSSTSSRPLTYGYPTAMTSSKSRVELIPNTLPPTYDSSSPLSSTSALPYDSSKDISSKDFDFDDIFTYDRPQQKLSRVVEVSAPNRSALTPRERDWSNFSFSHYSNAVAVRQKANARIAHNISRAGGMYVRNQVDAVRRR